MKRIFTLLTLIFFTVEVYASSYQVEIIIFENLHHSPDGEISRTGLKLPDFTDSIILDEGNGANDSAFKLLPTGLYKLGGVYNELKFSRNYRPLLHMAWQQPALNQYQAKNVLIRKIEGDGQSGNTDPLIKIEGTIRVRSAQFLHVDVDLYYFVNSLSESFIRSGTAGEPANSLQTEFAELRETRKMKLNELHYFDNPIFGLLLWVSRINN